MSKDAITPTMSRDDGKFIRTALVVGDPGTGSVDVVRIVDGEVVRLAQINIFLSTKDPETFMVDVIDIDDRYAVRRALTFSPTERHFMGVPEGGNLVATHFEGLKRP